MIEVVIFFGMLGLLTSIALWMISAEGNKRYFFPLTLVGLTSGWLTGLIWVYATGGLSLPLYAVLFPVVVSLTLSAVVLFYLPEPKITESISPKLFNISIIILIVMGLAVAYTSIPITSTSTYSTEDYSNIQMQSIKTYKLDDRSIQSLLQKSTNQIPMDISALKSSVSLMSSSDTPYTGSYVSFRITFSVSNYDWVKPYIKLAIFKDNNENGEIDEGDELWNSVNYKFITNLGSWRANVKYENGQPTEEIFAVREDGEIAMLPIFHASQISTWRDDTQYTFTNTPEGYTPPQDMLSWDGDTLKETVVAYQTIPAGSSSSIEGKIYCPPNSQGKYLLLVQAFDARFTDPYKNDKPIAQKIIPFEIKEGKPEITIDWTMGIILAVVTVPSIFIARRWWS